MCREIAAKKLSPSYFEYTDGPLVINAIMFGKNGWGGRGEGGVMRVMACRERITGEGCDCTTQ
jgi:hypothetical protein